MLCCLLSAIRILTFRCMRGSVLPERAAKFRHIILRRPDGYNTTFCERIQQKFSDFYSIVNSGSFVLM